MKVRNDIELKTCHDIRHWTECKTCGGIGDNRRMIEYKGQLSHPACLVENVDRVHLLKLPTDQLEKFTMECGVPFLKALMTRLDLRRRRKAA